jgi:hypothetical protein
VSADGLELVRQGNAVRVRFHSGRSVVIGYELETPRGRLDPEAIDVKGAVVRATSHASSIRDLFALHPDGVLSIQRSWSIRLRSPVRLPMMVTVGEPISRWVIPAVMYDGNTEGTGRFPRGGLSTGWSFREDRVSIPSCAEVAGEAGGWVFFTRPAAVEQELSSVRCLTVTGGVALEISTPFEESPFTYTEKGYPFGGLSRADKRWFPARSPFQYEREFFLLPTRGPRVPYAEAFGAARERCRPPGLELWREVDWSRYIALKAHWLRTFPLYRKGGVVGINRDVRLPALLQRFFSDSLGGSFFSRSLEAAMSFHRLGGACGDQRLTECACEIADFFLRGALPNGLSFDEYSLHKRRFGGFFLPGRGLERVASTRCMGEGGRQYVRLYRLARASGASHEPWLRHACAIADFFVQHQPADGNYGRFWSPGGELLDARGTNGAYIIWLMVELYTETGNPAYLRSARKAADYYITAAIRPQTFTFDTLDAECTDKEAGHALLRAFLLLHGASPEAALTDAAYEAAAFCLSWQFVYDVPFNPTSKLGALRFHTFGGTAVSVAHHHLDPYGLAIARDFLQLGKELSDGRWADYARDLMGFCGQAVSTPESPLDLGADFAGYQPEMYNHTNWDYVHHLLGGKGAYGFPASWVASCTLGACLDIRDEFSDELPGTAELSLDWARGRGSFPFPGRYPPPVPGKTPGRASAPPRGLPG